MLLGTGGDVSIRRSICSLVILRRSHALIRSSRGRVSSMAKNRDSLPYCMDAMRWPSAFLLNEKKVPMVLRTPVKSDTDPIPIDAIVASVKIEELEPLRNPTRVDSTIVGKVTAVLRIL